MFLPSSLEIVSLELVDFLLEKSSPRQLPLPSTAKFEFNSKEDKVQFYKAQPEDRKQVTVSHIISVL